MHNRKRRGRDGAQGKHTLHPGRVKEKEELNSSKHSKEWTMCYGSNAFYGLSLISGNVYCVIWFVSGIRSECEKLPNGVEVNGGNCLKRPPVTHALRLPEPRWMIRSFIRLFHATNGINDISIPFRAENFMENYVYYTKSRFAFNIRLRVANNKQFHTENIRLVVDTVPATVYARTMTTRPSSFSSLACRRLVCVCEKMIVFVSRVSKEFVSASNVWPIRMMTSVERDD